MSFSDEQIISFLMGEASETLAADLRRCMTGDSELVARVQHFRSMLTHLDGAGDLYEPPSGLVESTLQRMLDEAPPEKSAADGGSPGVSHPAVTSGQPTPSHLPKGMRDATLSPARLPNNGFSLSRYRVSDSMALTLSLIAMCCLLLPTMLSVRVESRRLQCAENLRGNGQALIQFALRCPDRRFPAVAQSGPEAFSGIYAVRLGSVGLLDSTNQLFCISMKSSTRSWADRIAQLPTIDDLHRASPVRLVQLKKLVGGDYSYNLGIIERHGLVAPKNNGSSYFAILADSLPVSVSEQTLLAHSGRGVNILYDDGHVQFICRKRLEQAAHWDDHPFFNRLGDHEAGLDDQDASLAPSFFPPLSR
jgi:prepilin-type processing-associated H-X9-DG protein